MGLVLNRKLWVGTSGYGYPEWKGKFYPKTLRNSQMLEYYSQHFNSVEINNTFYCLPEKDTLREWVQRTPDEFVFSFKAPRQITHFRKLKDCEELLKIFFDKLGPVRKKMGVILFQLPPTFKFNLKVLEDFIAVLPDDFACAFEFRHESWFLEETFKLLSESQRLLCIADSEKLHTPVVDVGGSSYFRLRDEGYQDDDLERWSSQIDRDLAAGKECFVYFKHESKAIGPDFAKRLNEKLLCV